jgi:hypothetical protein
MLRVVEGWAAAAAETSAPPSTSTRTMRGENRVHERVLPPPPCVGRTPITRLLNLCFPIPVVARRIYWYTEPHKTSRARPSVPGRPAASEIIRTRFGNTLSGGGGVALDIPKSVFFGRKCERFFESCFSNQFRLPSTRTTRCTRSPPTPRLSNILRPLFLPSSPFVRRDARV